MQKYEKINKSGCFLSFSYKLPAISYFCGKETNEINMIVAAFDFDGTITTKDTMFAFIRFVKGDLSFIWGMFCISPYLLAHKLGFISAQKAKEKLLTFFFKNESEQKMYELGERFCEEMIPSLLRPQALACIENHQKQGHICYLVTASLTFWTKKWAEKHGFILVATRPLIENDTFTGKIVGENCNGAEKVARLLLVVGAEAIEKKYAYGDTSGDRELLTWADEGFFKLF